MAHHERPHEAPPANKGLLWAAGAILAIPVIAIMWVGSYSRVEPRLGAFPFFIWYQMLWVILTAICTSIAYRLVLKARPHRPMSGARGASTPAREADARDADVAASTNAGDTTDITTTNARTRGATSATDEEVQR